MGNLVMIFLLLAAASFLSLFIMKGSAASLDALEEVRLREKLILTLMEAEGLQEGRGRQGSLSWSLSESRCEGMRCRKLFMKSGGRKWVVTFMLAGEEDEKLRLSRP